MQNASAVLPDQGNEPKKHSFGLSDDEILSIRITVIMTGATLALLCLFTVFQSQIGIALSAGAVGGFLHEFVQSKGKVLFIQQKEDGLYLGSVSGLILGMVAGLLVYGGATTGVLAGTTPTNVSFTSFSYVQTSVPPAHLEYLIFQSLIAGLALKGVSEAATSPAQSKDDLEILAVNFTDSVEKNKQGGDKIMIHIKNNSSGKLHLQLVKITDPEKRVSVYDVSMNVEAKNVGIIPLGYQWASRQGYTITVVSLNGQDEKTIGSP